MYKVEYETTDKRHILLNQMNYRLANKRHLLRFIKILNRIRF